MHAFSPEQDVALRAVAAWLKAKPGQAGTPPLFRLFGYAGTGKTTLARHIAEGVDSETPTFELWPDSSAAEAKLIVIDECSMVDGELARDLMSFAVPLLVLGDPAQLPPIQGGGFFTDAQPDAMLTEVHRQAQNDPIVRLSM